MSNRDEERNGQGREGRAVQEVPRAPDVQPQGGAQVHRVGERQGVHQGRAEGDDQAPQPTPKKGMYREPLKNASQVV